MQDFLESDPHSLQYSIKEEKLIPLWDHQKEGIARAKFLPHFGLFFEPGAGKTRTTIEILKNKFEEDLEFSKTKKFHNTLILAPKVILEQWKREWERFSDIDSGQIELITGEGGGKQRVVSSILKGLEKNDKKNFILITNYETLLSGSIFEFLKTFIKVLVCDESSRLKDIKAKRTKRCIELSDLCTYRYLLSGTPVLNSQLDIFSQFRILDGGTTFGKNFYAFRGRYFHDKNASWKGSRNYFPDFRPTPTTNEEIRELIRPLSMRVTKEECMDLPPLVREEVFVSLTPKQRVAYNEMKEALITFLNDKTCVAQMALTKCIRLQQMVSGFMKFDDESEKSFEDFEKLSALRELLEDIAPNHKVIIWCIYKRNYEDIRKICSELHLGVSELHGEITDKDAEVQRFQSDLKVRVMIANPSAGGLGVNLTSASYSIFYSRSFSLEHDIQAEARNHRGGSKEAGHEKITRIDLVVKDSIDELIMIALKSKLATATDILDLLRKKLR